MFSNQSPTDIIVTETARDCWELCAVYEECKNWTFRSDDSGNKCLLITNDAAPVISEDRAAISGTHMCNPDSKLNIKFQSSKQISRWLQNEKRRVPRLGPKWRQRQIQTVHRRGCRLPMDVRHDPGLHAVWLERRYEGMPGEELWSACLRFRNYNSWQPHLLKRQRL